LPRAPGTDKPKAGNAKQGDVSKQVASGDMHRQETWEYVEAVVAHAQRTLGPHPRSQIVT
jgi:hypothetical protein